MSQGMDARKKGEFESEIQKTQKCANILVEEPEPESSIQDLVQPDMNNISQAC